MKTAAAIRSTFIDYFARHGHRVVPSSALVPHNDPTLMFTNSGMVQFKNVFTGLEQRDYKRATTAQKCVRAGGKHNDLENVGHTARHHTFFEMLGNFSFGDYFKEQAIAFAWELVTKDFALDPKRLTVTVYPQDDEARTLWKKIAGLGDDRIIGIEANLWAMGETGPCGYCSEIFYDHGSHIAGGPPGSPDEDGDRFVEIWNNVFMQFEQVDAKTRVALPKPSIDTGMGLERMTAVMQGTHDNYAIDLMRTLIEASAQHSGSNPDGAHRVSHRVIADHLRASGFLIAEGVLPSNEGRGYVLRRIMRRAMRHAHLIGTREPLLYKLVPTLLALMGDAYPELKRAQDLITATLQQEETRFRRMLVDGLKLLDDEVKTLPAGQALAGEVAFKLYDTYGFPLDLTVDALKAQQRGVDLAGFEAAMAKQRAAARKAWQGSGEASTDALWFDLKEKHGATEFLGYSQDQAEAVITALVVDGNSVGKITAGTQALVLVNQTPFYAESGGQVGDSGVLRSAAGDFVVNTTQKYLGDVFAHSGQLTKGTLQVGDSVIMQIDSTRRRSIRAHHTATHLLNEALRRILGTHVTQKGSLVQAERLRFDISHNQPLSGDEVSRVEDLVNHHIRENSEVTTRVMPIEEARSLGAQAMFGEKYGAEVRVVGMGVSDDAKPAWSVEFCGGTHVARTGELGLLKIISQSSVSAGVRRLEAVCGEAVLRQLRQEQQWLQQAADALKTTPREVNTRIATLLDETQKLKQQLGDLRQKLVSGSDAQNVQEIAGIKVLTTQVNDVPTANLRTMVDTAKKKLGSGVVVLAGVEGDKVSLLVGVTADLANKISAVDLVQVGAASLGGKGGGGRPEMAQAGGTDPSQINQAFAAISQKIAAA